MDSAIRKALQNKEEMDNSEQMNFINGGRGRQLIQDSMTFLYSNNWQPMLLRQWLLPPNVISDSTKRCNLSSIMPVVKLQSVWNKLFNILTESQAIKAERKPRLRVCIVCIISFMEYCVHSLYYIIICTSIIQWTELIFFHQPLIHYSGKVMHKGKKIHLF